MKDNRICVRLSDEDRERLDFIMKKSNQSISEAIREAIESLFEQYYY